VNEMNRILPLLNILMRVILTYLYSEAAMPTEVIFILPIKVNTQDEPNINFFRRKEEMVSLIYVN